MDRMRQRWSRASRRLLALSVSRVSRWNRIVRFYLRAGGRAVGWREMAVGVPATTTTTTFHSATPSRRKKSSKDKKQSNAGG